MAIDKVKATRVASVIAGGISAIGWGYLGLSEIWSLPLGNQIWASANVVTGTISIALAAITARKGFREDGSYGDITTEPLWGSEEEDNRDTPGEQAQPAGDGQRNNRPSSSLSL